MLKKIPLLQLFAVQKLFHVFVYILKLNRNKNKNERKKVREKKKKLIWLTTRLEWMYVLMVGRSSSRSCQRTNRKKKQIYKRMYVFSLTRGWSFPSISSAKNTSCERQKLRRSDFLLYFGFGANLKEREWRIEGWLLIILILLFYFFLLSILCVSASSCSAFCISIQLFSHHHDSF
jgi:hypothetical protein